MGVVSVCVVCESGFVCLCVWCVCVECGVCVFVCMLCVCLWCVFGVCVVCDVGNTNILLLGTQNNIVCLKV